MAKNFPLLVLLLIAQSIFTPLFSGNSFDKPETNNFLPDECDAPAPDSFRVTSRGANFITVVWNPVWTGAMHTLAVFTRPNSTSPWSLIDSFNNVAGSTLTVNNVPFDDECKMVIATNCLSGEPSMHKRSLLDKIIIELATGGRIPVNPVPISCMNIPIPTSNSSWIGFQVIKPGFTPQNTFEIRVLQENPSETKIQIKRVYENNIIYASKDDNSIPPPTLVAPNPFKMIMRTLNGDLDIGRIIVTKDISTINLCQSIC